jgi:hypothetical protein
MKECCISFLLVELVFFGGGIAGVRRYKEGHEETSDNDDHPANYIRKYHLPILIDLPLEIGSKQVLYDEPSPAG